MYDEGCMSELIRGTELMRSCGCCRMSTMLDSLDGAALLKRRAAQCITDDRKRERELERSENQRGRPATEPSQAPRGVDVDADNVRRSVRRRLISKSSGYVGRSIWEVGTVGWPSLMASQRHGGPTWAAKLLPTGYMYQLDLPFGCSNPAPCDLKQSQRSSQRPARISERRSQLDG